MRDDFDAVVAGRFTVLDDVPVPDTWSQVQRAAQVRPGLKSAEDLLTLIDLEPPSPTEDRRKGSKRLLVAGLAAAAAVVAIAVVVTRNGDDGPPADQPSPTVTVPPATPPRALSDAQNDERFVPAGTYFVDVVDGTPTARIFVTIGVGWNNIDDGSALGKYVPPYSRLQDHVGFIAFSRPDQVYEDACHLSDGFHPGPVTTLDGLVAALREQQGGWVDVTTPSDISIDGYPGKTFQRTAPAVISDCPNMTPGHMRLPEFGDDGLKSWQNEHDSNFGGSYYEPGQVETLMVLDIDGTIVVIHANLWAGSSAAERAEFAGVLDSIRIDPRPLPNVPGRLEPGTYYIDEVDGTPTARISATIDAGWENIVNTRSALARYVPPSRRPQNDVGYIAFGRPDRVFKDACQWSEGVSPVTLDGLVTALREQKGWVDVTAPSDISVDGYPGKTFQRAAPGAAVLSDCRTTVYGARVWPEPGPGSWPAFRSWENGWGGEFYEPGETETLLVLDIDGTVVVVNARMFPGSSAEDRAEFAAVLDSIRIDRP